MLRQSLESTRPSTTVRLRPVNPAGAHGLHAPRRSRAQPHGRPRARRQQ
ncbi:hypothetical protein ACFPM0_22505 [Pseudonocardia sulfidoxydans]